MVYSDYLNLGIIFLARKGFKEPTICKMLKEEKLSCTWEMCISFLRGMMKQNRLVENKVQVDYPKRGLKSKRLWKNKCALIIKLQFTNSINCCFLEATRSASALS